MAHVVSVMLYNPVYYKVILAPGGLCSKDSHFWLVDADPPTRQVDFILEVLLLTELIKSQAWTTSYQEDFNLQ